MKKKKKGIPYINVFCGHRYYPNRTDEELKKLEGKSVQEICISNPQDKIDMDIILAKKKKC